MGKLGVGISVLVSGATLIVTPALVVFYPDPLVAFLIIIGLWVFAAITVMFAYAYLQMEHNRNAGRMYQGGACRSQLPDYMATQNYFNQDQMRRDLDSINDNTELDHIQNRLDHMKL